jgi:hypothetical protein
LKLNLEFLGKPFIVIIQKGYPSASSQINPGIASTSGSDTQG